MRTPIQLPPPPDRDPYSDPLVLALIAEVAEHGQRTSVASVLARAGVSEEEFARRYDSLEDFAVEAYEQFIIALERRIGIAFNSQAEWRDSLRAAAYEMADFMEEDPKLVRIGMIEVLRMKSEIARVRREELFGFFGELIDRGRDEPGAQVGDGQVAAMFAIGSIMQLLTHRLQEGAPIEPHATVPEMMYAVVRTYLGEEIAREELSLPRPPAPDDGDAQERSGIPS
jgi:AcrR family transcriptional regulator